MVQSSDYTLVVKKVGGSIICEFIEHKAPQTKNLVLSKTDQYIEKFKEGMSISKIAEFFGVNYTTIHTAIKKYKLSLNE